MKTKFRMRIHLHTWTFYILCMLYSICVYTLLFNEHVSCTYICTLYIYGRTTIAYIVINRYIECERWKSIKFYSSPFLATPIIITNVDRERERRAFKSCDPFGRRLCCCCCHHTTTISTTIIVTGRSFVRLCNFAICRERTHTQRADEFEAWIFIHWKSKQNVSPLFNSFIHFLRSIHTSSFLFT